MRRFALVLVVLAGCGGKAGSGGPPWPKSAGWETDETWQEDGGESLEPRAGSVAGVESGAEPVADVPLDFDFDPVLDEPVLEELPPVDAPPPPGEDVYVPEETIIIEGEPAP